MLHRLSCPLRRVEGNVHECRIQSQRSRLVVDKIQARRVYRSRSAAPTKTKEHRCYSCQGVGHLQRDFPSKGKAQWKQLGEAPGKTRTSTNSSSTSTILTSTNLEDLTEEELERLLVQMKLAQERSLLPSSNNTTNALSGE